MFVTKEFSFDSAHYLTDYYGKCEQMHGHTYWLKVTVEGKVQENGMVIDFALIKQIVKNRILNKLDHKTLNDIIPNPSAERIAIWIWKKLVDLQKLLKAEAGDPNMGENIREMLKKGHFEKTLRLHEIELCETEGSCVTYRGD
jgi:6-pyruvoyltetrahydropterin/6-carboxytetrahydropterin synthase